MRPSSIKEYVMEHLLVGSAYGEELGSPLIQGPPGVGKSEVVDQVVRDYNKKHGEGSAELIDIRLTLCDPSDLRGIPVPDMESQVAHWFAPENLPNLKHHAEKGILFFDDLTTAPPLVQAAAYQLVIQPHMLGTYKLPEGWVVVGACNRKTDQSATNRMPMALANRFFHMEYQYNLEDWTSWAFNSGVHNSVIAFLNSPSAVQTQNDSIDGRGHLLFNFNPNGDMSFATPRTWEMASRILNRGFGNKDIERDMVYSAVGDAAASTFFGWTKCYDDLPPVEDILEKRRKVVLTEVDQKYAMIVGLVGAFKTAQHIENALDWAESIELEFQILLVRLMNSSEANKELLARSEGLDKIVEKFWKISQSRR